MLAAFSLIRGELRDEERVAPRVRAIAVRMPTYITLKDVKKRLGQEDILPIAQFEKLWTALPDLSCKFAVVSGRGEQLKEPGQLDGCLRDGTASLQSANDCPTEAGLGTRADEASAPHSIQMGRQIDLRGLI